MTTKFRSLRFLALLSVFMAIPGCAGVFDKCVKPVASQITWTGTATELGEVVAAFLLCDPGFSGTDAPACAIESLNQLAAAIGPDGEQVVNCIIAYYGSNGSPSLQGRARAVGAKRGVSQALRCSSLGEIVAFTDRGPDVGYGAAGEPPPSTPVVFEHETPAAGPRFAYAGESVAHAALACQKICGSDDSVGSPGAGCLCWRGPHDRRGGWIYVTR
jgi:hypothetical protein